ncbi:MAG: TlpA family protein disulfide reductase [Anaerolineae bacterium]|jgi:cytochrome c biogenesis protein CcmG/thiol:disulfide interchange protein DsbE|nr:TlpA family protein disulfide reductase [Anaerolineae bacterium]
MTTTNDTPNEASPVDQTLPEGQAQPKGRRIPAFAIVLVVGVLFLGGLLALMLIKPPQKALCDEPAPDWSLTLFPEYTGGLATETINLSDFRGKGVVLNFWASWCKPCEEEAALLEAKWREYKDQGIVFLGVDYLDQDPAAKRYLEKFDITYANGPDLASKISKRYTIRGVPETFFIDPQGNIVGCRKIGPFVNEAELDQRIAEIKP